MQSRVGSDQSLGGFARGNLYDESSGNVKKEHQNTINCSGDKQVLL
jgi:hypothetical protein